MILHIADNGEPRDRPQAHPYLAAGGELVERRQVESIARELFRAVKVPFGQLATFSDRILNLEPVPLVPQLPGETGGEFPAASLGSTSASS